MIVTRTPFRITFGGGGTDLSSFYKKYGGFVFSATIDKYLYITVNRPVIDDLVRVKYSKSETTDSIHKIKHELARECCKMMGIEKRIEIISMADIPAGTGLGSSSSYTVGLLNALHTLKRNNTSLKELAEEACKIEIDILGKPIGKQDQYIATFGGLTVLEIEKNGEVDVSNPEISPEIIEDLESNILIFYEGTSRKADTVLSEQNSKIENEEDDTIDNMLLIKEIGRQSLKFLKEGKLKEFGELLDEHWIAKKHISSKMTNYRIDSIYGKAKEHSAVGGKIMGAGGGGFFMFYCENSGKSDLREFMAKKRLRELRFHFDFEGTKVLANF